MRLSPSSGPAFRHRRVGLLGGSFNPAHAGHRAMSLFALKRLGLDEIWWLVSPQNPLKNELDMAPLADRADSAAAVIARHPRLRISLLETEFGTRYTVDTLAVLKRRFPATRFVWLMGADNWSWFHRWHDWQAIAAAVPIAVFRRPGYAAGRGLGKAAQRLDAAHRPATAARLLASASAPAWVMLDNKLNPLSATAIRRRQNTLKGL